jgi:hypothetical protein
MAGAALQTKLGDYVEDAHVELTLSEEGIDAPKRRSSTRTSRRA